MDKLKKRYIGIIGLDGDIQSIIYPKEKESKK
jgi:hypothetical protein